MFTDLNVTTTLGFTRINTIGKALSHQAAYLASESQDFRSQLPISPPRKRRDREREREKVFKEEENFSSGKRSRRLRRGEKLFSFLLPPTVYAAVTL